MLSRLASAQKDDADRCHEHQDADDLEWQIVISEKQQTDIADIVGCRPCEGRKRLLSGFKMANNVKNLEEQGEGDGDCTSRGQPADLASFFGAKIEKHDDEKIGRASCRERV